jgi:hypothetical protein
MRITIVSQNTFCSCADDDFIIGGEYELTPAKDKTLKQNSTFHALIQEYWRSGCHSYNAKSFKHFRECIKRDLGVVEPYYRIIGTDRKPCEPYIDYRNKSVSKYTKKELMESIDRLIAEMIQAQVQTNKFYEILRGLEQNSMKAAG